MSQYDSIEQKASYGIGRNMGDQLAQQAFAGLDIPALHPLFHPAPPSSITRICSCA